MSKGKQISRREFLVRGGLGTAGVLAVGTYLLRNPIRRTILDAVNSAEGSYLGDTSNPTLWFEILMDNTVRLHSPKVEMGQGSFTSFAQMAADELDVAFTNIEVVHATTATGNIDGMCTGGSTSVSSLWQPLRELAATLREMIKKVASEKMGVSVSQITTSQGSVTANGVSITYAEIAKDVTEWSEIDVPELRDVASYEHVGKPLPRIDLADKVFGAPIFGMDAEIDDQLFAAVVRPDKIGATFIRANTQAAAKMPGVVKIIEEADFVGVVAKTYQEAENAKEAIEVEWKVDSELQQADLERLMTVGNGNSTIIQKEGNKLDKETKGMEVLQFRSPIGAHAQLEPNGVLAFVEGNRAIIKIATQVVGITRKEVAERLGFEKENVNVIPTYLGGSFGRRLHTPHAVQAAVMSEAVGKPVKYFFSRKEEFQHDMFRPPTHHIMKGKLNTEGQLEYLEHHFVSGDVGNNSVLIPNVLPTLLGADIGAVRGGFIQYSAIPNYRAVNWHVRLPFATSWWRSLGLLANTFAIESFIDYMAEKAGKNAVDFRIARIGNSEIDLRLKACIRAASEKSGYSETIQNNRAMGFAACVDAGTPCAMVAEVSVLDNEIKVEKMTMALDPGLAVNPDQVKAQCEGCVVMGISAALHEEMYIENGELRPVIYGPYRMAQMKHAPKEIDVILLQGRDVPGPVGEPPLGPVGAAIANAVARLTGKRLTRLPLKFG